MPICLCLFIGIPASGKTTTARRIVSFAEEKESTGIVVNHLNYDDFVQPKTCYRDFRKGMLDRIEDYVQKHTTPEKSMVLIVDDCMILRSMRKEVHSIARKHRLGYFQVWFRIPLEKSIERNRMRVNSVPEDTIEKLFSTLEDPVKDSNVDTLVVDLNQNFGFSKFKEKVLQHLDHREKPPELPQLKEKVTPSDLHRIDLILRHEISRRVRDAHDRENVIRLSKSLNDQRKDLLRMFRESSEIPQSIDEVRNLLISQCDSDE